jgi:hypothetical protein
VIVIAATAAYVIYTYSERKARA